MNNLTQPAFPVVPLQDNFKRLVVPIPGLSKLEHFALELFKQCYKDIDATEENRYMEISINSAINFLNVIEEKTKNLTNDKDSEMAIFNH
jgi:hypothetical protein